MPNVEYDEDKTPRYMRARGGADSRRKRDHRHEEDEDDESYRRSKTSAARGGSTTTSTRGSRKSPKSALSPRTRGTKTSRGESKTVTPSLKIDALLRDSDNSLDLPFAINTYGKGGADERAGSNNVVSPMSATSAASAARRDRVKAVNGSGSGVLSPKMEEKLRASSEKVRY